MGLCFLAGENGGGLGCGIEEGGWLGLGGGRGLEKGGDDISVPVI